MKAEFTGVKIKLGDEEKIITPQQAEELRDALTALLGPKKIARTAVDYFQEQMSTIRKSDSPNPPGLPSPYQSYPQYTVYTSVPKQEPYTPQISPQTVVCGDTSVQTVQ